MTSGRLERMGTYSVLMLFSVLAIYPVLSILFLALHRKSDLVTGFAVPTHLDLSSFKAAWTEGKFGTGFKSSFIVAAAVTALSAVLSIGSGYAFGTMRFLGDRFVFPVILLGQSRTATRLRCKLGGQVSSKRRASRLRWSGRAN